MRMMVGMLLTCGTLAACGVTTEPTGPEAPEAEAGFDRVATSGSVAYPVAPEIFAHVYTCDGDYTFIADFDAVSDTFLVRLPEREVRLPHQRSASGAKYGDGDTTYWNKGNDATLTLPDGTEYTCTEDRRQSILESARLRGATHRGSGNEPGWIVEVSDEKIVFVYDNGMKSTTFLKVASDSRADGATEWTAASGERAFTVSFRDEPCEDTMSGEVWPQTVHAEFDGVLYAGCGAPIP